MPERRVAVEHLRRGDVIRFGPSGSEHRSGVATSEPRADCPARWFIEVYPPCAPTSEMPSTSGHEIYPASCFEPLRGTLLTVEAPDA